VFYSITRSGADESHKGLKWVRFLVCYRKQRGSTPWYDFISQWN